MIKDSDGDFLSERRGVLIRWQQYVDDQYKDGDRGIMKLEEGNGGPYILKSEVKEVVRQIKWQKSEGNDGIVVEKVEGAGDVAINKVVGLENKIYESGEIPEILKQAEFNLIPKKEGATE